MDTKDLETLDLLHFSPVNVNGGMSGPPFSIAYDQLLCLAHIERDVVVLAPHCQFSDLLPIGWLIVVLSVIRPTTVVSSANLMMVLESCLAMQSWVNREYKRGLSTHPWGAPVLRISVADVLFTYPHHLGAACQSPGSSCRGRCLVPGSLA